MKFNRLLVFAIAIAFLLSVNFAFAVDENITQAVSEVDDNLVKLDDSPQNTLAAASEDIVSSSDDSGVVGDEVKTIVMGKVTKRYNGVIEYSASFYDVNGTPLKKESYTVDPNPEDYHYTLSDVVVQGEVTYPDEGEKENRIGSFKLTDPFGNQVTGQALAQMVDTVNGKLRVTPRSLTVSAVKSQITTSDGRYINGYHQEGLLSDIHELAGDFVTGRGKTTFKTEINDKLRVRVKGTNEDVTKYYNITKEAGLVTITDVSPTPDPTVHDIVITLKSGTWTYDGKPHYQPDYEVSGLVDGDKISKVNFKPTAVITDVGTEIGPCSTAGKISIQDTIEKWLKADANNKYILFDHGSGEIADYIAIQENDNQLIVRLFHAKKKTSVGYNSSMSDVYEVAGQAVKSITWLTTKGKFADKVSYRHQAGHCKAVRGDFIECIRALRDTSKQLTAFIVIVQPALSRSVEMPDKIQEVLAAAESYIKRAGKVQGLEILGSK